MAELHVFGQIVGASGFPNDHRLFCKWGVAAGNAWRLLEGAKEGQTQVDHPVNHSFAVWSHPVDLHFATKGLQGWPKLYFQVWRHDEHGRSEICAYGFSHIPTTPGTHMIDTPTWRPVGSFWEELQKRFVGGGPELRDLDNVYNSPERFNLQTATMGRIHLSLNVILRHFDKFAVEY